MSNYRRNFRPGGFYFFTLVTYNRRPILTTDHGRTFLRDAITTVRKKRPFKLFATVLLPDHWHLIMRLPAADADYSCRLKRIKEEFTRAWLHAGLEEAAVSNAQQQKGERGIWQPRFWEHSIQTADNLERCVDYIHWNPRKHQLTDRIRSYPWSSFHRFVAAGQYDLDWGGTEPRHLAGQETDWGEPTQ